MTVQYIDIINAFRDITAGTAINVFNEGCGLSPVTTSILGQTIDFNSAGDLSYPVIYHRDSDIKINEKYDTYGGSTRSCTVTVFFLDLDSEVNYTPLQRAVINDNMIKKMELFRNAFIKLNIVQPVSGSIVLVPINLFADKVSGCMWTFQTLESIQMKGIC